MAGHTPVPWTTGEAVTGPRSAAVVWLDYIANEDGTYDGHEYGSTWISREGRLVCIVPGGEGDMYAGAAFIVRACNAHEDLLAACDDFLSLLRSDFEGPGGRDLSGGQIARVESILAKARG